MLGDRNVWSRPADGTGVATLVHDDERSLGQGTWSPDGEWLVFRTMAVAPNEGTRDIVALRPGADSTVTPLVATSEYAEHAPALSPDGRTHHVEVVLIFGIHHGIEGARYSLKTSSSVLAVSTRSPQRSRSSRLAVSSCRSTETGRLPCRRVS